jgi:hypothetical protein
MKFVVGNKVPNVYKQNNNHSFGNLMGMPVLERQKTKIINDVNIRDRPLYTKKKKVKKQVQFVDNREVIDTNLSSQKNKTIIKQIDTLLFKIKLNIESGSFSYKVVNDIYELLGLFENSAYILNSDLLQNYKNKIKMYNNIFKKDKDYTDKIIGKQHKDRNILNLVSSLLENIKEILNLMIQNQSSSVQDRKLILQNKINTRKFVDVNKKAIEDLKGEYDVLEEEKRTDKRDILKSALEDYTAPKSRAKRRLDFGEEEKKEDVGEVENKEDEISDKIKSNLADVAEFLQTKDYYKLPLFNAEEDKLTNLNRVMLYLDTTQRDITNNPKLTDEIKERFFADIEKMKDDLNIEILAETSNVEEMMRDLGEEEVKEEVEPELEIPFELSNEIINDTVRFKNFIDTIDTIDDLFGYQSYLQDGIDEINELLSSIDLEDTDNEQEIKSVRKLLKNSKKDIKIIRDRMREIDIETPLKPADFIQKEIYVELPREILDKFFEGERGTGTKTKFINYLKNHTDYLEYLDISKGAKGGYNIIVETKDGNKTKNINTFGASPLIKILASRITKYKVGYLIILDDGNHRFDDTITNYLKDGKLMELANYLQLKIRASDTKQDRDEKIKEALDFIFFRPIEYIKQTPINKIEFIFDEAEPEFEEEY